MSTTTSPAVATVPVEAALVAPIPRDAPRWVGGVAAMLAVVITHPIDQTKIRAQTQAVKANMLTTMRNTIQAGGIRELWVGLSGSLLRQGTYGSVRFGIYGELNARGAKRRRERGGKEAGALELVKNGAIAGVFAGVAGVPGELVLVRLAGDGVKPPEKRLNYKNAFDGLYRIYKENGIKGMFRGLLPTTARSVILNSSQLSCYDLIKRRLLGTGYFSDTIPLHLLSSALGGTVAVTLCTPVDVVKSRIQASTGQASVVKILQSSIQRDGLRVLFRGWLPAWLRMTPTTALTFMFMEQIKKLV